LHWKLKQATANQQKKKWRDVQWTSISSSKQVRNCDSSTTQLAPLKANAVLA
jgi:hypothetical protein